MVITQFKKGHKQSNSGRTHFKKGFTPWNKGLHGPELLKHYPGNKINIKGLIEFRPKLKTEEIRKKLSESHKKSFINGKAQPWKNKRLPAKQLAKLRIIWASEEYKKLRREIRSRQIVPMQDTSIETRIQTFLRELDIFFMKHYYIKDIVHRYRCDLFVPSMNTVLECDGDYWHANPLKYPIQTLTPKQKAQTTRDLLRTRELIEAGYKVIRLWESQINKMDIEDFIKTLSINYHVS